MTQLVSRSLKRNQPCPQLDLGLLASRTVKQPIFVGQAIKFVGLCCSRPRNLTQMARLIEVTAANPNLIRTEDNLIRYPFWDHTRKALTHPMP